LRDVLGISLLMLFLINVVLGVLLAHTFLFRPSYFFEKVFPKRKPDGGLLFSKKTGDSDLLVLYFGFRFFIFCFFVMVLVFLIR
jgi:hypothetical protein